MSKFATSQNLATEPAELKGRLQILMACRFHRSPMLGTPAQAWELAETRGKKHKRFIAAASLTKCNLRRVRIT